MYVTAMWLRSGDNMGVNVYLHRHDPKQLRQWLEEADDWTKLPDDFPGEPNRGRSFIPIRPGGNLVQAYLDFVIPDDDYTPARLQSALEAFGEEFSEHVNQNPYHTEIEEEGVLHRFQFATTSPLFDTPETRLDLCKMLREKLQLWSLRDSFPMEHFGII